MKTKSILLVALLLAFFLAFATVLKPQSAVQDLDGAKKLALDNAKEYLAKNYAGVETTVAPVEARIVQGGKFTIVIEIVSKPHTSCPQVESLEYELMPITLVRQEKPIKDCEEHPIGRREQALINSAKLEGISQTATRGYGCAFAFPFKESEAKDYCPQADLASLASFASENGLQAGSWIVMWKRDSQTALVALGQSGAEVARKIS